MWVLRRISLITYLIDLWLKFYKIGKKITFSKKRNIDLVRGMKYFARRVGCIKFECNDILFLF